MNGVISQHDRPSARGTRYSAGPRSPSAEQAKVSQGGSRLSRSQEATEEIVELLAPRASLPVDNPKLEYGAAKITPQG